MIVHPMIEFHLISRGMTFRSCGLEALLSLCAGAAAPANQNSAPITPTETDHGRRPPLSTAILSPNSQQIKEALLIFGKYLQLKKINLELIAIGPTRDLLLPKDQADHIAMTTNLVNEVEFLYERQPNEVYDHIRIAIIHALEYANVNLNGLWVDHIVRFPMPPFLRMRSPWVTDDRNQQKITTFKAGSLRVVALRQL